MLVKKAGLMKQILKVMVVVVCVEIGDMHW